MHGSGARRVASPYRVTDSHRLLLAGLFRRTLTGTALLGAIGGWGMLSGQKGERANRLDRIIVTATVGEDSFRLAALQQRLHQMNAPYGAEEIKQALTRLDLAYIIARGSDGAYRYRVPLFVDMMREQDLDLALSQEIQAASSP